MGKIFEAVRKTEGTSLDLERLLPDAGSAQPQHDRLGSPAGSLPIKNGHHGNPEAPQQQSHIRSVRVSLAQDEPLLPFDDNFVSSAADQYKIVRTKIAQHTRKPSILLTSSAGPGDGKSVSAINVAAALAVSPETSVILVDGDFRGANLASSLGVSTSSGLSDVLSGKCQLTDAIVRLEPFQGLYLLPTGKTPVNSAELLASPLWKTSCAYFREHFRFTVIDSPPVGAVADYDLLQAACDGVIFVVRPDHTKRSLCMNAIKALPKGKLLGVLMNGVDSNFFGKGAGHYYGYGG